MPDLTPTSSHQTLTAGQGLVNALQISSTWSSQDPGGRYSETPEAEKRQEMNPGSQDQPKQSQDRNAQLLPPGWASQARQVLNDTRETTTNESDGSEPCPSTRPHRRRLPPRPKIHTQSLRATQGSCPKGVDPSDAERK